MNDNCEIKLKVVELFKKAADLRCTHPTQAYEIYVTIQRYGHENNRLDWIDSAGVYMNSVVDDARAFEVITKTHGEIDRIIHRVEMLQGQGDLDDDVLVVKMKDGRILAFFCGGRREWTLEYAKVDLEYAERYLEKIKKGIQLLESS